ncbi:queuosine precursor transporter [Natronomonas halophila]|uniref:queuosine precursor transporter n=1 Tax=Natronomonas halophila TaxID=2747817 RepID=UPI0015B49FE9|nr:queuosine precursor transporter [Natronomonas halophila]QLD86003.1 queuosine precursor transporter [Natronomonas halophila]
MSSAHVRQRLLPTGAVALAAMFVTALVTSQVTASKLLLFQSPVALPVTGTALVLPGAALAYALTFLATDCYTELYGKRAGQVLVNIGFLMNFLLLALVYSTIAAPAVPNQPIDPATFAAVLGQSGPLVVASLAAYLVSQNYDVLVFHKLKELTDGEMLWLRNIASTGTSQAIDTVIFVGLGFYVLPQVGFGATYELGFVLSLIVGQYALKLLIALVDTPFVYLITGVIRRSEEPQIT